MNTGGMRDFVLVVVFPFLAGMKIGDWLVWVATKIWGK